MAVADVYDALTSTRPYKKPFTHEAAMTLIIEGRGRHFDPVVVDAFVAIEAELEKIGSSTPQVDLKRSPRGAAIR